MSIEDVRVTVRGAVEGLIGKLLLGSSFAIIMAISGLAFRELSGLHSDIADHSSKLSSISQKIDDLILSNDARASSTDAAIDRLSEDSQAHAVAIARAETEIEELKSPRVVPPQIPIPQIGGAIEHIFPGFPTHPRERRRR